MTIARKLQNASDLNAEEQQRVRVARHGKVLTLS